HCLERIIRSGDCGIRLSGGGETHLLIFERADASRQSEQTNEACRVALLIDVVFTEGDETLVIQRKLALAANDSRRSLEQAQRHGAGDTLLRDGDERIVRLAFRGPPTALVHEIRVAWRDEVLRRERPTIEYELLELRVRRVQQRTARRLINAARLHADEAILD